MANEEQVEFLKESLESRLDLWNEWRRNSPNVKIDLSGLYLPRAYLDEIDLDEANLQRAMLDEVELNSAYLSGADLRRASLYNANCHVAIFRGSNLSNANLFKANFQGAVLDDANLSNTGLESVNLSGAELFNTNFQGAKFHETILGDNNLSACLGLETVEHHGPSYIGIETIQRSRGKIPLKFLRGCGLSDIDIEYAKLANPELTAQEVSEITHRIFELKDTRPIQISPLFISYSHANSDFVDTLETKLNEKGIRFWRDIHDAKAGRLETQIDRAIRHNPTVLLILSEHSTSSDWVEHEARLARKLEKELGRDVLCPIALDDSWKTCNWPERIKEQIMEYNILDFSNWEDDAELNKMFKKLIDGLDMFYKK